MGRIAQRLATFAIAAFTVTAASSLSACSGASGPTVPAVPAASAPVAPVPNPDPTATVAIVTTRSLAVYPQPTDGRPGQTLASPDSYGAPLVLLVRDTVPGWLHVLLPVRPNGSTGWIHSTEVTLSHHQYRVEVELGAHQLSVYQAGAVVLRSAIADGAPGTPTPTGLFYTTDLLRPTSPNGPYGPYAFGLSGHSDILQTFAGGDGEIGLHGTNEPASIGHDVSHGCIRVPNEVITRLASLLPVGVPVDVRA